MASQLNRREFLRIGAVSAPGFALAGCATAPAPVPAPAAPSDAEEPAAPEAAAPEAEAITLEFVSDLPEYENGYRQILDIFEVQNPGTSINLFSYSEDTEAAYLAKVAGGFLPAMERIPGNSGRNVNKDNYMEWVDLSETNRVGCPAVEWSAQQGWQRGLVQRAAGFGALGRTGRGTIPNRWIAWPLGSGYRWLQRHLHRRHHRQDLCARGA